MAQKFIEATPLRTFMPDTLLHLSDGTPVWIATTLTGTALVCSTDRASVTTIASFASNATVCCDAADNLYVFETGTDGTLQAFLKQAGHSWVAQTSVAVTTGRATGNLPRLAWADTGGGTGGAGHLLLATYVSTSSAWTATLNSFDAGALLGGSGGLAVATSLVANSRASSWGIVTTVGALSPDGFGATSGLMAVPYMITSGTLETYVYGAAWSVNSGGVLTVTTPWEIQCTAPPMVAFARVSPGVWALLVGGGQPAAPTQWEAYRATATTLGPGVLSGTPAGMPMVANSGGQYAHFADPVSPGKVWVLAVPAPTASASAQFQRIACDLTTGTPVWDAAATADDTVTNAPTTAGGEAWEGMATVLQPRYSLVDWLVAILESSSPETFATDGDYSAFPTAPAPPSLISPANAQYEDVTSNPPFELGYNSVDGFAQNAQAFRIKVGGAGSYSYFNASTNALQSTIVWNAITTPVGGQWAVTLPAGYLTNGTTFNWSGASQESSENLQGAFAPDATLVAQAGPSVVVTNPAGTVTGTTNPAVTWTGSFGAGAAQTDYQVVIESGGYGSTPGSGTQAWSSGLVASAATTVPVGAALVPGVTYRAFVQLTETGALTSTWGWSDFTLNVDLPATPILDATPTTDPSTGAPMVQLAIQPQDNRYSAVDSSFETGTGTWIAGANTTIAQSSAEALDGSYSLALTATGAGNVSASLPTNGYAVSPGVEVSAVASFRAAATARTCTVAIEWYTSAGALISTSTGASVVNSATGWTMGFVTAVAPATAAYAVEVVTIEACAAGEVQYVDCAGLFPGANTTWTVGGFVGTTVVNVTFSDDGVNWYPVRGGTAIAVGALEPLIVLNDYEGALGFTRQYQAIVVSG